MPGTSEVFEIQNFDGVANKLVAAIRTLINNYSLACLVEYEKSGIPREVCQQFKAIKDDEWRYTMRNVIFSKVTAMKLNNSYSSQQIQYLVKLLAACFEFNETRLIQAEDLPEDYKIARKWLQKAHELLRVC